MKRFVPLLFLFPSLIISSCSDDEENDDVAGVYVGSFNVNDPSYQNTSYTVNVSRLSGNTIRVSPSTSHGTPWEVNLMKISGALYTCINCAENQVTVTIGSSTTSLNYNYGDNNEQFSGIKQ